MAAAKKATAKRVAPKKHYIVTFDISGSDPVCVLDSLDKAKKFATALISRDYDGINEAYGNGDWDFDMDDVENDSIRVYEAVLIGKPKVEITFSK